jgi:hypothetical protein
MELTIRFSLIFVYMVDEQGTIAIPGPFEMDGGLAIRQDAMILYDNPNSIDHENALVRIEEPVLSRSIYDIVSNFNSYNVATLSQPTIYNLYPIIFEAEYRNDSTSPTKHTFQYQYSKSISGIWKNKQGRNWGVDLKIRTGVPVLEVERSLHQSAASEHEWGGTHGIVQTVIASRDGTVQPGTHVKVQIFVRRMQLNVEFSYKENVVYNDGFQAGTFEKTGVYTNDESYKVDVRVEDLGRTEGTQTHALRNFVKRGVRSGISFRRRRRKVMTCYSAQLSSNRMSVIS